MEFVAEPYSQRLSRLWNGKPVFIYMSPAQVKRLMTTSFRPKGRFAGNFLQWRTPKKFLQYAQFLLEDQIFSDLEAEMSGEYSFEVRFKDPVGWSSTWKLSDLPSELPVETRQIARDATGWFLAPESGVKAQLTHLVTCVVFLREMKDKVKVVFYDLYPGRDIGELDGNISDREGVVFLDPNTPGEVPPNSLPSGLYMTE